MFPLHHFRLWDNPRNAFQAAKFSWALSALRTVVNVAVHCWSLAHNVSIILYAPKQFVSHDTFNCGVFQEFNIYLVVSTRNCFEVWVFKILIYRRYIHVISRRTYLCPLILFDIILSFLLMNELCYKNSHPWDSSNY
jgi:hypothetical protein